MTLGIMSEETSMTATHNCDLRKWEFCVIVFSPRPTHTSHTQSLLMHSHPRTLIISHHISARSVASDNRRRGAKWFSTRCRSSNTQQMLCTLFFLLHQTEIDKLWEDIELSFSPHCLAACVRWEKSIFVIYRQLSAFTSRIYAVWTLLLSQCYK